MKCKNKNVITIKEEIFYQKIMWALKGIILPLNLHINCESINSVQCTHRDMIWNNYFDVIVYLTHCYHLILKMSFGKVVLVRTRFLSCSKLCFASLWEFYLHCFYFLSIALLPSVFAHSRLNSRVWLHVNSRMSFFSVS